MNIWAREWRSYPANLLAEMRSVVSRMDPRTERIAVTGAVVSVHAALLVVLILGLVPTPMNAPTEVSLVLVGGPQGKAVKELTEPDVATPEDDAIAAPQFEIVSSAPEPSVAPPSGSPNVTRPAIAIPSAHSFPTHTGPGGTLVRLLLDIAADGAVMDARVIETSGSPDLDRLALDWVKAHWRYQPALENGRAVAVSTMAVVAL